jgi:hypothetical protein
MEVTHASKEMRPVEKGHISLNNRSGNINDRIRLNNDTAPRPLAGF